MGTEIDWVACERLIGSLASKFRQDGLEIEDLKQEARLAVLEHHGEHSPSMGVSYNTFIGRRIRDAIRTYVSQTLGIVEVSREWVAESIADGPEASIRAKDEAACEALRQLAGPEKFKRPRRISATAHFATSLDAQAGYEEDDKDGTLHDVLGTPPGQEAVLEANRRHGLAKTVEGEGAAAGRHGGGEYWATIARLREEGRTFAEIGKALGKSTAAVQMAWDRAQKRLNRRIA